VAVTLLVAGLGLGGYTLSDQAMSIVGNVPQAAQRIRERLRAHRLARRRVRDSPESRKRDRPRRTGGGEANLS